MTISPFSVNRPFGIYPVFSHILRLLQHIDSNTKLSIYRWAIIVALTVFCFETRSQDLAGLSTKWDDTFSEWIIYGEMEYVEGEISMRWPTRGDWTEWDFRIGELSGQIKTKWNEDANLWELRSNNEIVTIKTVWKDDWRQWEIQNGDLRIDMKSKWSNIFEEWTTTRSRYGEMQIYTSWEGDLRDWVIEDNLDDEVTLPTKIALAFIPVFYSTPKF